ncbi:MAG: hypothetical protein A3K66_01355 [Euryarchaeota archaeon RBG_16_67_27]|nr:MAG: hypothetical protein A3K66_01355 [Euryarchaeota archaeon RBG_16_67_27]
MATAITWFALVIYQVARDRYRTWTEVFFLGAAFFAGLYALSDLLFFNAVDLRWAETAALASFTALTLSALFFMLFGVVFYTRMRRTLFLAAGPGLVLLPYVWLNLVVGFESLEPAGGPPYVGEWDDTAYLLWAAFVLLYAVVGAVAFFLTYREVAATTPKLRGRMRGLMIAFVLMVAVVGAVAFFLTYREVAATTPKLRGRMRGLMIAFVLMVALGSSTNLIRGIVGYRILPLFSTAMILPAAVAFLALSPMSKERLSVAVRKWKARHYDIKAAILIFEDGTLIDSKVRAGERMIDQDLFSGTLDVIQNFMRTSIPLLRGKWLRSISQGDYTLVIERVRRATLTLVLSGQETDQLRRQMRDLLLRWEDENRRVLDHWNGLPEEAVGTDALLAQFFIEAPIDLPDGFARPESETPGLSAPPKG